MKRSTLIALVVLSLSTVSTQTFAQEAVAEPITRPRTVAAAAVAPVKAESDDVETNAAKVTPPVAEKPVSRPVTVLTPQLIRTRISEAERLLKGQARQTALAPAAQFVTLAALEKKTGRVHLLHITKTTFLTKGAELTVPSSLGTVMSVRILRANGVNTAVTVFDDTGTALVPLVVEFPIEKHGAFKEMAYYTSAHPALLSPALVSAGRAYVRDMLDLAAKRLREKGTNVSPQLIDIAERLCLVEHVDHFRFRQENRRALYDEIYSLYALNELDTYRYSVSSAGAGGMVQMIPWAYNLMKQRHPQASLIPDFVVGMRTHSNALQAMLLYMHDTWNDLAANSEVQYALKARLATQEELMAAGYNSNAAKLPGYLRRGGSGWRNLIPRETQMYLQIYKSVDSLVPMKPRSEEEFRR